MRAMVTGAAGFIGSHLAEALLARGDSVLGVDCLTDYYDPAQKEANLRGAEQHAAFELVREDVGSPATLERLAEVDVVFHLAGQPGVRLSWDRNFHTYVERNLQRTQELLEAARAVQVGRVVYASSSSVYGNQPTYPVTEEAVPNPFSPYGVTKLAAEHLCSLYAQNHGLSTASLRFFTVYGPRQRPDMAFSKFIRATLAGAPITVTGDGSAVRDFTYVGDIVSALLAAAEADVAPGRVFNTCGTESVTVRQTIEAIGAAMGTDPVVEHVSAVPGDVPRTGGDSTRANAELGWTASVPLAEGLARQVAWERDRA